MHSMLINIWLMCTRKIKHSLPKATSFSNFWKPYLEAKKSTKRVDIYISWGEYVVLWWQICVEKYFFLRLGATRKEYIYGPWNMHPLSQCERHRRWLNFVGVIPQDSFIPVTGYLAEVAVVFPWVHNVYFCLWAFFSSSSIGPVWNPHLFV